MAEHELLVFAAFWFTIGAVDEFAIDAIWIWLRVTGRVRTEVLPSGYEARPLTGRLAVLVPAWREPDVIGEMIAHTLAVWPQPGLVLYVGCYGNDTATLAAAVAGARGDPRVRLVVHDRHGPTTKADCLNRLYAAMAADERRWRCRFTGIILHDAEDMVHPAALTLIDRALQEADYVQLPVRPEPQRRSPWIAGHYSDEFTEAHAKTLVVRDALGAGIPTAGVGCGFARAAVAQMAAWRSDRTAEDAGPFAPDCLTEDYEVGLLLAEAGARGRFIRVRDGSGALVATRAFFPATIRASVRQKTRWIHGIALQGWDRLGWSGLTVVTWMALRDRKGPLLALVLASAYALVLVEGLLLAMPGIEPGPSGSPLIAWLVIVSFASFAWRACWRLAFTAREYGWAEGMRAVLRIPIANVIAIMAGRRALAAYVGTLRGEALRWDKTEHARHPAAVHGVLAR